MKKRKLTQRDLAIERARAQAQLMGEVKIEPGQMTPLQYLLMVINDVTANSDRRDRLAIAAAPYCHPKLMERHTVGKKDQRTEAAEQAGMGTPWAEDLDTETHAN